MIVEHPTYQPGSTRTLVHLKMGNAEKNFLELSCLYASATHIFYWKIYRVTGHLKQLLFCWTDSFARPKLEN